MLQSEYHGILLFAPIQTNIDVIFTDNEAFPTTVNIPNHFSMQQWFLQLGFL
jgi:hypothetical protein